MYKHLCIKSYKKNFSLYAIYSVINFSSFDS